MLAHKASKATSTRDTATRPFELHAPHRLFCSVQPRDCAPPPLQTHPASARRASRADCVAGERAGRALVSRMSPGLCVPNSVPPGHSVSARRPRARTLFYVLTAKRRDSSIVYLQYGHFPTSKRTVAGSIPDSSICPQSFSAPTVL